MNKFKLFTSIILLFTGTAIHAQTVTENIKVSGVCGDCKKHIEKAAKEAGAEKASWNKGTKVLAVSFDKSKTTDDAIQKKVAGAGYDTEKYAADDKAYNALDECCQYDRKSKK